MKVRGPCIHQGKTFWAEVAASYSASPDPTLPSVWSHFPLAPCFDTLPTPSSSTMTRLPPTTSPPQIATSLGGPHRLPSQSLSTSYNVPTRSPPHPLPAPQLELTALLPALQASSHPPSPHSLLSAPLDLRTGTVFFFPLSGC